MNKLVKTLMEKPELPALFTFEDFKTSGYTKEKFDTEIADGILSNYINRVYNNIYTLNAKYREKIIPQYVLSQMIVPDSYVSMYRILRDWLWIPELIFAITSITSEQELTIDTDRFGTFLYIPLYKKLPEKGIYIKKDVEGTYRAASPLRALCDLLYFTNKKWPWSLENIYESFRIPADTLAEDLTGKDFDELHGVFGTKNIENFLIETRKELQL